MISRLACSTASASGIASGSGPARGSTGESLEVAVYAQVGVVGAIDRRVGNEFPQRLRGAGRLAQSRMKPSERLDPLARGTSKRAARACVRNAVLHQRLRANCLQLQRRLADLLRKLRLGRPPA